MLAREMSSGQHFSVSMSAASWIFFSFQPFLLFSQNFSALMILHPGLAGLSRGTLGMSKRGGGGGYTRPEQAGDSQKAIIMIVNMLMCKLTDVYMMK